MQPRTGVPLKSIAQWAFGHGLDLTGRAVCLRACPHYKPARASIRARGQPGHEPRRAGARQTRRTLGTLINNVATTAITGAAVLIVLDEFGVNITPVLTGAGIAGLAVGFGAQTLVRDIISGFFMILEDQVRVGDSAAINGTGGLVEQINLRTIVLRDEEGTLRLPERIDHDACEPQQGLLLLRHHDGDSLSRGRRPGHGDPPERRRRAPEKDSHYGVFILEPIEIMGMDAFADWAVQIKLRIKTVPQRQHEVGRELRKRIRRAFDEHKIAVPFPERLVAVQEGIDRR